MKNTTPFIKPIKTGSGTFYTCTSAGEDLQLSLSESKNKFRFSKFALLKIPDLYMPHEENDSYVNDTVKNTIQLKAIPGAYRFFEEDKLDAGVNSNTSFADSFQNYFYNLESAITSDDDYDVYAKRTVSERVFFKWLKEIGAMRFKEAKIGVELSGSDNSKNAYGIHYVEHPDTFDSMGNPIYERVVKYIGNINVINSVKNLNNSYSEIYIHVPTSHGSTKDVLFTAYEDENYMHGKKYVFDDNSLVGRTIESKALDGMSNEAMYDSLESFSYSTSARDFTHWTFDKNEKKWYEIDQEHKWWYANPSAYTYYLEEKTFNDPSDDIFAIGSNPNDENNVDNVKFFRSRLDGISLEFDKDAYYRISSSASINSLGEYNASSFADKFSFNTVLVYYDVYDEDNPSDCSTNLFGILFLDSVRNVDGSRGRIESLTKAKSSTALQQNGNAYAFKLNIKLDLNTQDSSVEVSINDYNTYSLHLYTDALTEMKKCTSLLQEHIKKYRDLEEEITSIKAVIGDNAIYESLAERVSEVETEIANSNALTESTDDMLKLIAKNTRKLDDMMNSKTPLELAYNIDVFEKGSGIAIDRSNGEKIKLVNENQCFNIGSRPVISLVSDASNEKTAYSYEVDLREYDNYLRINDHDILSLSKPLELDRNVSIKINDSNIKWKNGQRFRISFEHGLTLDNTNGDYIFYVYTNKVDNKYTKQAAILTSADFNVSNAYKPIIELICLDEDTLEFAVDVF